jgi:hypothetical protein
MNSFMTIALIFFAASLIGFIFAWKERKEQFKLIPILLVVYSICALGVAIAALCDYYIFTF